MGYGIVWYVNGGIGEPNHQSVETMRNRHTEIEAPFNG